MLIESLNWQSRQPIPVLQSRNCITRCSHAVSLANFEVPHPRSMPDQHCVFPSDIKGRFTTVTIKHCLYDHANALWWCPTRAPYRGPQDSLPCPIGKDTFAGNAPGQPCAQECRSLNQLPRAVRTADKGSWRLSRELGWCPTTDDFEVKPEFRLRRIIGLAQESCFSSGERMIVSRDRNSLSIGHKRIEKWEIRVNVIFQLLMRNIEVGRQMLRLTSHKHPAKHACMLICI